MESFRTIIPTKQAPFEIGHADPVLLTGSCFTEHIGERLRSGKIPVCVNPYGIVYNPVSIADALLRLLEPVPFTAEALFEHQGLWHSSLHHGRFSGPDPEQVLAGINAEQAAAAEFLRGARRLFLTLGSAQVHARATDGRIVANCHKLPAQQFTARRLGTAEIVKALGNALMAIRSACPQIQVVLSVSPVRHLRLGAVENQRSKAALVLACAELEQRLPDVHYFPSYELLLDDLRDYRFYADDMAHPSPVAVQYIWEHFSEVYFTEETRRLIAETGKISRAAAHRPFHPETPEHQSFVRNMLREIEELQLRYPSLDWSAEKQAFEAQLIDQK